MLRREVLPAPFGPMIEAMAPRFTEIETSSTARTPPNRFDTPRTSSSTSSGDDMGDDAVLPCMLAAFLPKTAWRLMRRRYGCHDAGAAGRMQPLHGEAERGLPS